VGRLDGGRHLITWRWGVDRDNESYEERAQEATKAPDEGADQQHEAEPAADDEQSSRAEK
jgi:hypothetical protein